MRKLAAVISGYALWTIAWLAGNALLKNWGVLPADETQAIHDAKPLLVVLGLSVACSVLAGFVAGLISRPSSRTSLGVLGILLFASGCYFEFASWNLTPIWYHAAFLVMLVPATFAGGRLGTRPGTAAAGKAG
jgi:hypothetical protein